MATIDGIPISHALSALRSAIATIAEAITDEQARTAAMKLDRVLVRWISLETHQPAVVAQFAADRAALAARGADLLRRARCSDTVELAELAHALTTTAATAPSSEARTLLHDILATDLAQRRAFEQVTDQVRAGIRDVNSRRLQRSVDADSWERYLHARRPDSPPRRVYAVRELTGGVSKRTYLVELATADDADRQPLPDKMVIRMDTGNFATTVLDEYRLLQRLNRAGVPVPQPLWLEGNLEPFGHPFLVTQLLPGSAPGTLLDAERAAQPAALALAEGLANLHSVPIGALVDSPPNTAAGSVAVLFDKAESEWRAAMAMPSVPMEIGFAALRERLHDIDGPAVLVHGECGLQNILLKDGRLQGMLDWEFWHVGDPAEDLAYCRPTIERLMPWKDFMACYTERGGPNVSEERLRFFDVWCQLRNAVLAAGVLHRYANGWASGVNLLATAIDTYRRVEVQLAERVERLLQ